ncbi:MAG: response regulator [Ktedonobacteraceae bacterium]
MDEGFDQNSLSPDDLAILQAFDAMDLGNMEEGEKEQEEGKQPKDASQPSRTPSSDQHALTTMLLGDEMLALFVGEVEEDLTAIRDILRHVEPEEDIDPAPLQTLQRFAHKVKGTSGAIGCTIIATIAYDMEELTGQIARRILVPFIGLHALLQTVYALEMTLNSVITYGKESDHPLAELEAEYHALNIAIQQRNAVKPLPSVVKEAETPPVRVLFNSTAEEDGTPSKRVPEHPSASSFVRVDMRRFEQLVSHTEDLAELQAAIKNAQVEVEQALQELHVAQVRLRQVEALVSIKLFTTRSNVAAPAVNDERPTSSLVARILDEAAQRTGHLYQRKSKYPPQWLKAGGLSQWDTLELDHFTENDVLIHSFDEAIADVATASTRLRTALTHLNHITQAHMAQATNVRNDTLLLRLAPLSSLLNRIERAVMMSALAQQRQVRFEIEGETTEIDQDILEELKQPLLQLVRTCLAQSYQKPSHSTEQSDAPDRIWLHARTLGNEVMIELGFSMTIGGGALDGVQETIQRLHGSITVEQNRADGITFVIRLPRTQGAVRSLLVRIGSHQVVVPFAQVQRIDDGKHYAPEECYSLTSLLGFPMERAAREITSSVLIVQANSTHLVVQVDEIIGDVELVVKPLAPHLQRPGIAGTVIDGMRNVMLVVEIPELVRQYALLLPEARAKITDSKQETYTEQGPPVVLIADDSVYIRHSVRHALSRAGYRVIEAEDGMKALELLVDAPPDALLLDMEMPNLNGYDVLSMMRVHPELAHVKVIMLTSHTAEKHQTHARKLGAHVYLTKPCPDDMLLSTLHTLLTS